MVHNGGSRAAPAHRLRITTRFHASPPTRGGVAFDFPYTDSDERLAGWCGDAAVEPVRHRQETLDLAAWHH
jgi:hypothetical protein